MTPEQIEAVNRAGARQAMTRLQRRYQGTEDPRVLPWRGCVLRAGKLTKRVLSVARGRVSYVVENQHGNRWSATQGLASWQDWAATAKIIKRGER